MKVEMVNRSGEILGVTHAGKGISCNPFYVSLAVSTKRSGDLDPDREYDTVEVTLSEQEVDMLISMLRG